MKKSNVKKTYPKKSYKKKYMRKATPTKGVPKAVKNYQIINTIPKRVYQFEDCFQINDIVGTGNPVSSAEHWHIYLLQRYAALVSMFRQYRINYVKYRFRLNNLEASDNAIIPVLYVRHNYDPDLLNGAITENWMLRQSNVAVKTLIATGGSNDISFEYTVKPAVLGAYKLFNSTNFVPNPVFNRWCDFDPSDTLAEVDHLGLCYLFTHLPSGINVNIDCQMGYSCRDLI